MGASLALSIRAAKTARLVWALSRDPNRLKKITRGNVFHSITGLWSEALDGADLIVLASPIETICGHLGHIEAHLQKYPRQVLSITDIGSVKKRICDAAAKLPQVKKRFIGAHPLCGSEKSGVENAVSDLYLGARCILTAPKNHGHFSRVENFWKTAGCITQAMTPGRHDKILGYTSHLPHVLSFLLADLIPDGMIPFSSGSYKSMTRVAKSDPKIWTEIFENNTENIIALLQDYEARSVSFRKMLSSKNTKSLEPYLRRIQKRMILNHLRLARNDD